MPKVFFEKLSPLPYFTFGKICAGRLETIINLTVMVVSFRMRE